MVLVFAGGLLSLIYLLHTSNTERGGHRSVHGVNTEHVVKRATGLIDRIIDAVKSTKKVNVLVSYI